VDISNAVRWDVMTVTQTSDWLGLNIAGSWKAEALMER
jgi:hypothetical protein